MKKKICYLTTIASSIRSFFLEQLYALKNEGFDVTVICSPDEKIKEDLGNGIKYIPVDIPRGISFFGSFKSVKQLTKIFKKEKFDLVQYSTPNAAFYASIAAKKAGIKIRNYHLMGLRYLGASGIFRKILYAIEKKACKNSTHIECVSASNLELSVKDKLFPREKATVVYNGSSGGLNLNRFDIAKRESYRKEIREQYEINKNDFVFGFVGRITKDKGVNEILTAFNKVQNAKLLMVGNPEGTETLNKDLYNASLNNQNIIYTGSVNDVEKYYSAMDVLLFPSYREGFGNVVMEAAAMGTTAIISDIPGPIDEVINDKTALVVPVKDAEELSKAMIKLQDRELVKIMSKEATSFVREKFDSKKLNEKIIERKNYLLSLK